MSILAAPLVGPANSPEPRADRLRETWPQRVLRLLTTPVVYSLLLPFVLLDLWTTAYQWICFPVFGVATVSRTAYFAIDRHRLAYLDPIDKVNCTFCSYANGVLGYVMEVAARTEQYWCPIKHARPVPAPHHRYADFVEYGDGAAYRRRWRALRRALRDEGKQPGAAGSTPRKKPGALLVAPRP